MADFGKWSGCQWPRRLCWLPLIGVALSNTPEVAADMIQPLRGIAYGALPCTTHACGGQGIASEDMLQNGYRLQWSEHGRDDLAVMRALGANTVRLYHSFGLDVHSDRGPFLNRAAQLGLQIMAGYHTENAHRADECLGFDCYDTWKAATLQGFQQGFRTGNQWHPAVSSLILLNEPDFFEFQSKCSPSGPWCRVKAVLSAMDAVLSAEREAGIDGSRVKLTVTWSFALKRSIDGAVEGPGVFGFQDMVAAIRNPGIAHYTPRTPLWEMQQAFATRWVHGLNTQSPWLFVNEMVSKEYHRFAPLPWFIGEYGGNGQSMEVITTDLRGMDGHAISDPYFLGAAVFQFQTTYWKGGGEMNFGLFSLGSQTLGETDELCDKYAPICRRWPVHCLSTDLPWLPGTASRRADAVAAAWGGQIIRGSGFCRHRRLRLRSDQQEEQNDEMQPPLGRQSEAETAAQRQSPNSAANFV